jgi:signal transduction histidine kinase
VPSHRLNLIRMFADLKVRPKLMVLHNLFFIVLAAASYFTLIPLYKQQVLAARDREMAILTQMFRLETPLAKLQGLEIYDYREGTAPEVTLPEEARNWLALNPGGVWQNPFSSRFVFAKRPNSGLYRRLTIPETFYGDSVRRAQFALFLVLGIIYVLAVVLLEAAIMPLFVYRPLLLMLDADEATQHGDRNRELIDPDLIPGDEIGQIMRSRNQTVTELRRQEDDLRQKNEMLEMQDRLASLGLMSASVAHELNTPLAVLLGSIEKLAETSTSRQMADRLERMRRVTERIRKISEGLLDFARARKRQRAPVDLKPLIDEAWSLVAIDEKAAEVRFLNRIPPEARVFGEADRLLQVFVNLLRNALNAIQPASDSREGGSIQVRSQRISHAGRPCVSIKVEDNGVGIPADVLPDIFEAFVTTRLDSKGTGLGLTVAEGIVQQHGGAITASNRPERGACLEVRLPELV